MNNSKSLWKEVISWESKEIKNEERWTGKIDELKNLFYLNGNINLYKFNILGLNACTIINFYAAYQLLSNPKSKFNKNFIDDLLNKSIDYLINYSISEQGIRVISNYKNSFILDINSITLYFKSLHKVEFFNTDISKFSDDVEKANISNFHKWLDLNMWFFTDKKKNDIPSNVCVITLESICYSIYFDKINEEYYLFNPHGSNNIFYKSPSKTEQFSFTNKESKFNNKFCNKNAYLLYTKDYKLILKFLEKYLFDEEIKNIIYVTLI